MTQQKRTREDIKKARELQKKKQRSPMKIWFKRILLAVVTLGIVGFLGGAGLFAYYVSKAPELDEELLKDPISSEFYDASGELFATIGVDEKRKYISYDEIPTQMVDAIIATEDARFFDHFGVDLWRLGGAVIANFRDGFGAQGASTITQQVVKNSFFTNEKRLERKAQEAWLAIQLERKYSKEEIFEMYFNKVLMSGTVYGFGTAAEYFYGKELSELTLDEMALLAGMPQSPNNYNPVKHPDRAEKRRNIVLGLMVQHDKITQADADAGKTVDVTAGLLPEDQRKTNLVTNYPAFLDVVLSELEANGNTELLAEGIKVYTTLDPQAQEMVESVMNNDSNFPTDSIQSGVSVVDTKTGALVAVGGGRNYGAERPYNHAYDLTSRAPGSTLKPLVDYGPAIEYLKWSTGETLVDEKMTYTGTSQNINNWDNKYFGAITMREALYASRNIPAVKALKEVTTDKAQEFISKLGIDVDYLVESDAIGGGRVNISPIQMAASYAAFGNNGVYTDPYAITKIEFRDGTSKNYEPQPTVAMSDSTAYMVTDVLRDVVSNKQNASGTAANVPGVDIAGKTGTTNYSADEFAKYNLGSSAVPDSWFVGYSPNYSIAIWSGYSQRSDAITTWEERRLPQKLFKSIMTGLSKNVPNTRFEQPNSVVSATIEVGTSPLKLASDYTPDNLKSTELFVRGTVPTEVSTNYEAEEIEAPSNVRAEYNEVAQVIDLTWGHNELPEEGEGSEPKNYTYEVTMQVDGGEATVISTTGAKQVTVPNIQLGSNYTFTVVAIEGENRSEPGSVSIYIDGAPPTTEEPDQPDIESPEIDDEENPGNENNWNNGNGSNNGNNGNNNGNSGNNGNNGNGQGGQPEQPPSVTPPTEPNYPIEDNEDSQE
ncbi:PBP1A family penicillin-binding protein [Lysinibacillus sp. KU-BSD001]|uniref:PBP1A family penicillin-binding protein n=1 Tax=Lysinibacillus sp. KU-BSD001 TaxID=3141328 RepID=UPI0036DFE91D